MFSSVIVEHQGVVSPSIVVQPVWETPMKLNGKAHADPAAGPSLVRQLALGKELIDKITCVIQ